MSDLIRAPEGVEFWLVAYLKSPSTGIDVAIKLKGLTALAPPEERPIDGMSLARTAGLLDVGQGVDKINDWRVMTREEIREYKAENPDA
jgi:hypothetical protein